MQIEGNGMKTCEQCGNPVPDAAYVCPYCQGHDMDVPRGALVVRRIDLGHVGLSVQEAREQLQDAIAVASFRGKMFLSWSTGTALLALAAISDRWSGPKPSVPRRKGRFRDGPPGSSCGQKRPKTLFVACRLYPVLTPGSAKTPE